MKLNTEVTNFVEHIDHSKHEVRLVPFVMETPLRVLFCLFAILLLEATSDDFCLPISYNCTE